MKKIIYAIVFTMILTMSGCAKNVPDSDTYAVKEPIYQDALEALNEKNYASALAYFVTAGDYKDAKEYVEKFEFLPVEIVAEDDGFGENMALYRTSYTYNEFGKLATGEGKYDGDVGPGYSEKHSYDADGRLIKSETQSEAGYSTETFQYDEDGNLTKRVGATDGANVGGITQFVYDKNGNCTEATMRSFLGIDTENYESQEAYHTDKVVYTYDAQGNVTKAVSGSGESHITYTAEYGENNLPTVIKSDDGQGFKTETVFEYDADGRCTKIKTPYDETVFSYENSDYPKSAIRIRDGGKPCNITYKYEVFYMPDGKPQYPFFMDEHLSVFKV